MRQKPHALPGLAQGLIPVLLRKIDNAEGIVVGLILGAVLSQYIDTKYILAGRILVQQLHAYFQVIGIPLRRI